MRVYIMTDLEGVAGVTNFVDWCTPAGRYYDTAKELLTQEVNAAVDGFIAGGATEIVVADGHGAGAINPLLLDPRVELMRGWPTGWPLLLDESYDAVAFVGQHAKAGTEYAHLSHTQDWIYLDLSINGLSIGEFGQFVLCAGELGIPAIFCSGDRALTLEAQKLVPGIEAVAVKRGTTPGAGNELDADAYSRRNTSAIHLHPLKAREAIRAGAERAVRRALAERPSPIRLNPPYEQVIRFRARGNRPRMITRTTHPTSIAAVMNQPRELRRLVDDAGQEA